MSFDVKQLLKQQKNVYDSDVSKTEIFQFGEDYKKYIDFSKTECRSVLFSEQTLIKEGFVKLSEKSSLLPGDKVYEINRGKGLIAARIGKSAGKGFNIVASHIDSPRLDLKPNPLYEDSSLALFKTHYYGGIKKYQWTTIPLALYGTVYLSDGSAVDINIGDNDNDPCFCVSDLLPHLASEQMSKKANSAIEGENLNLIVGSIPVEDSEAKERVKLAVLSILNEKYGIIEEDFISAEIEAVPAGFAKDIGFDRSLIGSYGHDDRVCSYCGLRSIIDAADSDRTMVLILADKEEIGSVGNTGMKSRFYLNFMNKISTIIGVNPDEALASSFCLSADVCNAMDPQYQSVCEKNNTAFLNNGVAILKYTGARGKSGTSDASAEFMSKIRRIFNSNEIIWQTAELGKVDAGGGGTVAQYIAQYDIDTVDCGVPLLSMHAPFEIASKADIYMAYKAYKTFYEFS